MKRILLNCAYLVAISLLVGCSVSKFIPEGKYLLDNASVVSGAKNVKSSQMKGYIRQHPNSRWFSLLKMPMAPYILSGQDTTRAINRFLRRVGEAPVIYDSVVAEKACTDMQGALRNMGYLEGEVKLTETKKRKKIKLTYALLPGERYRVRSVSNRIDDPQLEKILMKDSALSLLKPGMPFDINVLEAERNRINSTFQNLGFYKFNKEFIRYEADTTIGNRLVDLVLNISLFKTATNDSATYHRQYRIGNVKFYADMDFQMDNQTANVDSIVMEGSTLYYKDKLNLKKSLFAENTPLVSGSLYREKDIQSTYNNMGRLNAVMFSNLKIVEAQSDSNILNCNVMVATNKRHSFGAELEGTNSAGDLGAALSLSYQNRNLFRGSELLSMRVRGAFEAITGLEGYSDQNYMEISTEVGLTFPEFKFPFISSSFKRAVRATSEVSFMYDSQNRPEFHRRVLTAAWRYRWSKNNRKRIHRVDLFDLNYVFMPWISETFKNDYLGDEGDRNSILRYNYENLFIMKLGYTFSYNSHGGGGVNGTYGTNAYGFRLSLESAGNLLYGFSNLLNAEQNNDKQYTLFNIAYAQYVKGDFNFSKSFKFDDRNSLAVHLAVGIAFPYGNSTVLPYEKRYFSGGANSVRGWSVRGLGPGSYTGNDGRIDFINQTGDIKLDMSAEYRTQLFWKIHGALFIDAGNIWTIRNYEEQPGGQFHFDSFWKQIAVGYGMGFRLNFDYFILRLDAGMKAINPAFTDFKNHYPLIRPNFDRDFTFHFAVGLPF